MDVTDSLPSTSTSTPVVHDELRRSQSVIPGEPVNIFEAQCLIDEFNLFQQYEVLKYISTLHSDFYWIASHLPSTPQAYELSTHQDIVGRMRAIRHIRSKSGYIIDRCDDNSTYKLIYVGQKKYMG